ncbi:MAG: hypothetical protein U0736_19485 [Gemmataceae bacterium]
MPAAVDAGSTNAAPAVPTAQSGGPAIVLLLFAFSAVMAAAAVYLYHDFMAWEATGGTRKIHWLGAILYRIGGKWAIVGLAIFWAVLFLAAAIATAFARPRGKGDRKADPPAARNPSHLE